MTGYRYRFYIDGFNVYNAILEHCPQYLWLDYYKLAQGLMLSADTLSGVTYFSAYADWEPAEKAKQSHLCQARRETDGCQHSRGDSQRCRARSV